MQQEASPAFALPRAVIRCQWPSPSLSPILFAGFVPHAVDPEAIDAVWVQQFLEYVLRFLQMAWSRRRARRRFLAAAVAAAVHAATDAVVERRRGAVGVGGGGEGGFLAFQRGMGETGIGVGGIVDALHVGVDDVEA